MVTALKASIKMMIYTVISPKYRCKDVIPTAVIAFVAGIDCVEL